MLPSLGRSRHSREVKNLFTVVLVGLLVACGPSARLARPEQNVASRYQVSSKGEGEWTWTEPYADSILILRKGRGQELYWSVQNKGGSTFRQARFQSLQSPSVMSRSAPPAILEVRFSPSGNAILVQEKTNEGGVSQTILFKSLGSVWTSRRLGLSRPAETRSRRLDDGSRVDAIVSPAQEATILRLDDQQIIHEIDGKTGSYAF